MIQEVLPNIPRHYTALAEWLTCVVFIFPLAAKRERWQFLVLLMGVGQYALQMMVGSWPLPLWIPGMVVNVCWMFLTIVVSSKISLKNASYLCAKAFIVAEFTASFTWQMYCQLILNRVAKGAFISIWFPVLLYAIILTTVFLVEKRVERTDVNLTIQNKNVFIAMLTAVIIFSISNIGFIISRTEYSFGDPLSVFLIRSLINFCGIYILYMQENQQYEHHLQNELKAVNNIFQNHYEQYVAYKESASLIERKVHDLKHQIETIRSEENIEKKEAYLEEMTKAINTFSSDIHTGNGILDTILSRKNSYCLEQDIRFTCIVEGKLLSFLDTMDICSLFGNALDNAIEAVLRNAELEQRLVNLRVSKRGDFVIILVENYVPDLDELSEGLPETTKKNKDYHGYGLKSIDYIAGKYEGNMNVSVKNNWFLLKVLLPLPATLN
ncbi:ATP-binding protein [Carnobacterium maltaromaticum]|uniref:ATP-binding protein n=1 Tax=Carnobacterium maltaromaticum TaxID=2751 RepID=UPI0039B062A8